jgi:N-acyl homoserine lactone hydrolase
MTLRLYVLDGGLIDILDWSVYDPSAAPGTRRRIADPVYLVAHPEGSLVWDTGLSDTLQGRPEPLLVNDHALFHVSDSVAGQLDAVGHPAAGIDYLGLSHFHPDHVGNVDLFPDATLLVQRDEYDAAFGPDPVGHNFDPGSYPGLKANEARLLDGDHDVFGDETVVVKRLPGHTIGSQALLVRLAETGPVLLSGDITHSAANWAGDRFPTFNHSAEQTLRSLAAARELLDRERAALWIHHDHDDFLSRRHAPEFYV